MSSALAKLLEQDAAGVDKWVAATEGSTAAAPLELATGDAVMSIGGFNGTDPWPDAWTVFKPVVAKPRDPLLRRPGQPELRRRPRILGHRRLGGGPLQPR